MCFSLTIVEEKLDYVFKGAPAYFIIILFVFMLFYCIQPCFKCGYRTARYQLFITLLEILISPFGRVRFRDFFFADVITSIGTSLQDIGVCVFYMTHRNYEDHDYTPPDMDNSKTLGYYLILCGFAPFWFRFWQCINKYYYSK